MGKHIMILTALIILTAATNALTAFPEQWTRDPANPLDEGVGGSTVLFHDGIYKMWSGWSESCNYFTSPDGWEWEPYPGNPVLVMGPDWYDEFEVTNPAVVVVEGTYHMWYSCIAADGHNRIAHASSPDGIVWTKNSANPVLDLGPDGSWDDEELIHPFVIYEEPFYRMWYNGVNGDDVQRILYAQSFDPVGWSKYTVPALVPGALGDWDDGWLGMMSVLPYENSYYMFYTAGNMAEEFRIGCATSPDGFTWTKPTPSLPVLGPGEAGSWDDLAVLQPVVLATDTQFMMYYGGTSDFQSFSSGIATAELPQSAVPDAMVSMLGQNYPNPFNPRTTIKYSVVQEAPVVLQIHDAAGRLVRQLIDGRMIDKGTHEVDWDGRDDVGRNVPAGIYFYRLEVSNLVETKLMTLVK